MVDEFDQVEFFLENLAEYPFKLLRIDVVVVAKKKNK